MEVLTLVPLPKIEEIYAQLAGFKIHSKPHLRSSYYHIALSKESKESQKKLASVTQVCKFEFSKVPFGLT